MTKHIHEEELEHEVDHTVSNVLRVVIGMLIGSLAGAGVMLLMAPQSGRRTRAKLQMKGIELRDQASESLDDAVSQVRSRTRQITSEISDKAEELQQRGQDLIDEQKVRLSALRNDGKKALKSIRN
jgi:gas vesicle protein